MANKYQVFIGRDGDRYKLFLEGPLSVNPIGDRNRKGKEFPSSFLQEGWVFDSSYDCAEIFHALHEMQAYIDDVYKQNDGLEKKSPVVSVKADKKPRTSIKRR